VPELSSLVCALALVTLFPRACFWSHFQCSCGAHW